MKPIVPVALLALAAAAAVGFTSLSRANPDLTAAVQARSITDLRRAGPAGLHSLLSEYDRTHDAALLPTINAVAGQHDAVWSRLYWHTDLESAKAAAAAEHKPILALRMLGKLTDEYSCANSRFFRTTLYANEQVSKLLRDRFILVWTTERPVPVITIDFGDGRTLKRTITGNSIHYVLSPQGEVIDVLPGLYDPDTFAAALTKVIPTALAPTPESRAAYCTTALATLDADWAALQSPGNSYQPTPIATPTPSAPSAAAASRLSFAKEKAESPVVQAAAPTARKAADRAVGKRLAELTLVEAVQPPRPPMLNAAPAAAPNAAVAVAITASKARIEAPALAAFMPVPASADSDAWTTLARHRPARLDQHSIDLIRSQNPSAYINPTALDQVVNNFQDALAVDTLRNNQLFRRQILTWLLESPLPLPMESLNQRIYAELFLTPRSDPWLGLVPQATYSALTADGCSGH